MLAKGSVVAYEFRFGPEGVKVSSVAASPRGTRYLYKSVLVPIDLGKRTPQKADLLKALSDVLGGPVGV